MNTFEIVTVIAIILFARLGVRLVGKYIALKRDSDNDDETKT
ncbi:MAG: hypothetical protein RLN90_07595 [Balneolaceae bacterium]